jgi:tetratricopeptide (TPR) repeat protein
MYSNVSKGNKLICSSCGKEYVIQNNYMFNSDGIRNIYDYYGRIKAIESESLESLNLSVPVDVRIFKYGVRKYRTDNGVFTITPEKVSYRSGQNELYFEYTVRELEGLAYSVNEEFELYYKGELYFQHEDWPKAIEIYKLAEEQAEQTDNIWLKYKIYDAIGGVNQQSGNYQMCLDYGRKALDYILRIGRRSSICGAYMQMATTFAFLQQTDSAAFYTDKAIPYLKDYQNVVGENIHPDFFSNIGYNYMVVGRYEEAKQYLEQSLMVKVTAVACNYLAWIYKKEGDEEQSHLWYLKAHEIGDNWPKDKILYELLRYDIEHHNLEGAQEKLKGMMTISDSLHKAQMDRTILEYQHRFDEQVAQEAHQRKMIWVGIALGVLLFVIVLLALYIRYRRAKEQVALTEKQMLINNYVSEIAQLKNQQDNTDVAEQIEELNGKIRELVEQNSPRLVRGKMLYDEIKKDGTTSGWSNDDYKCFIDYYKAIDFPAFCRIQKKYAPNTPHNTFFLILYEMGLEDKDVRRIMGITQEAIRSTRYRILQNMKK